MKFLGSVRVCGAAAATVVALSTFQASTPAPRDLTPLDPDVVLSAAASLTSTGSAAATPAAVSTTASAASDIDRLYPASFRLRRLSADPIATVAAPRTRATSLATPSFTDPAYGTRIYRITAPTDYPGAAYILHEYSRRQAFNADNSRYLAQSSNGFWLLYDGASFRRLARGGANGALRGMAGDAEPIWHPSDPTRLWYTDTNGGLVWREKNVEKDTDTVLVDFRGRLPWPGATSVWTKGEGVSSADGRYFAFMATSYDSAAQTNTIHGLFTWDRVTNRILGTLDASRFDHRFPDCISISPDGRFAVPVWAYEPTLGVRAYSLTFATYRQVDANAEHSDLAYGPKGEQFYVFADYQRGQVRAIDLDTGASFDLLPLYPGSGASTAIHISAKAYDRRGWVLLSTYGDCGAYGATCPSPLLQPAYRKVFLAELTPGGRLLNVAHTRTAQNYGDYFGEPKATISRDGSRIVFGTNFNSGPASSYLAVLASWVYSATGAPTGTRRPGSPDPSRPTVTPRPRAALVTGLPSSAGASSGR